MIAIIFEVTPKSHKRAEYLELAGEMRPLIEGVEGFISVERFQSLTNPEKLLSISFFEDGAAVDRWRKLPHIEECSLKDVRGFLMTTELRFYRFFETMG